jgi:hypothetical protein
MHAEHALNCDWLYEIMKKAKKQARLAPCFEVVKLCDRRAGAR